MPATLCFYPRMLTPNSQECTTYVRSLPADPASRRCAVDLLSTLYISFKPFIWHVDEYCTAERSSAIASRIAFGPIRLRTGPVRVSRLPSTGVPRRHTCLSSATVERSALCPTGIVLLLSTAGASHGYDAIQASPCASSDIPYGWWHPSIRANSRDSLVWVSAAASTTVLSTAIWFEREAASNHSSTTFPHDHLLPARRFLCNHCRAFTNYICLRRANSSWHRQSHRRSCQTTHLSSAPHQHSLRKENSENVTSSAFARHFSVTIVWSLIAGLAGGHVYYNPYTFSMAVYRILAVLYRYGEVLVLTSHTSVH